MASSWRERVLEAVRAGGAVAIVAASRQSLAAGAAELAGHVPVRVFPPWDTLPYDRATPSPSITGARLSTMAALARRRDGEPLVLLTTARAALQWLRPRADVARHTLVLAPGEAVGDLAGRLAGAGYVEAEPANDAGEMAVRDSLVDVFPPGAKCAVRLELRDGFLAAIRPYDPASQRGMGADWARVMLPPGSEIPWDTAALERFLAAWPLPDHPLAAAIRAGRRPAAALSFLPLFCERTETILEYLPGATVLLEPGAREAADAWQAELAEAHAWRRDLAALERANGLAPFPPLEPGRLQAAALPAGTELPETLPLAEAAAVENAAPSTVAAELSGIAIGDPVIHPEHGIGLFDGIETVAAGDVAADCARLLYARGDRLLVPAERADMIHALGRPAGRLDRLGGTAWANRRDKVRGELAELARKMAADFASRRAARCAPVARPADAGRFDARFPHDLTRDQRTAIGSAQADLESGHPMDRLVCGDVGFGKTEVALRAAFAVASAGLQVAVIAPTTPLCRQHYADFRARFAGWNWPIAMLARSVPEPVQAAALAGLETGEVRLAVGTQGLLRARFARLGLVVVDEEQRLGVRDKDRLKAQGPCVHMLTMTATPIPRTLQLALGGLRDLSLIRTAPVARRPVRTFVLPFDPVTLRQALLREHRRGGQSFVICPRIEDLADLRARLAVMLPELDVATLHGKLRPAGIDRVLAGFAEGDHDVLLTTNIVETGLNLPGANTMVIHHAGMFGLAALHQLRGRVGRGAVQAYCYLTHEAGADLTEGARRRLDTVATYNQPGAGFDLALMDRDMRGGGTLLGEAQAGHVRELGAEYLDELMAQALAASRDERPADPPPEVRLGASALLPDSYVADPSLRLSFYRRLARADEPADAIAAELRDRFGPLPREAELAIAAHRLVRRCRPWGVAALEAGPKGALFSFHRAEDRDRFLAAWPEATLRRDGRVAVHGPWADPSRRAADLCDQIGHLSAAA